LHLEPSKYIKNLTSTVKKMINDYITTHPNFMRRSSLFFSTPILSLSLLNVLRLKNKIYGNINGKKVTRGKSDRDKVTGDKVIGDKV
jgi:hypothetical protein